MRRLASRALATSLTLLVLSACASKPDPACLGREVVHVPLIPLDERSVVPVKLNGQWRSLIFDTGAEFTILTGAAARDLGLRPLNRRAVMSSLGGVFTPELGALPSFNLAGLEVSGMVVAAIDLPVPEYSALPVSGFLGMTILGQFDLEADFSAERLSFRLPASCDGAAPAWDGAFGEVALAATPLRRNQVVGVVEVNGHRVHAMFDSGAPQSLVGPDLADALGLAVDADAPQFTIAGVDGHVRQAAIRRAERIAVGGVGYADVPLVVASAMLGTSDMVFGRDLMLGHRLFISRAAGKLFIQARPAEPLG